jgi:predicted lipoprotein with Yx(FWY)xxD motif
MTSSTRSTRYVVPRLAALVALGALALAACGGSSYGGSAATQPSGSNKPAAAASGSAVATGQTDVGTVLVDQNGKTLYAFAADAKNHSNCSGSCAQYWPPVTVAKGSPTASKDVSATLGTTTRSDGTTQLTVDGWPMYTYAGDAKAGDATGQGKNLSGGLWWVVDPSGQWVKKSAGTSGGGRGGY